MQCSRQRARSGSHPIASRSPASLALSWASVPCCSPIKHAEFSFPAPCAAAAEVAVPAPAPPQDAAAAGGSATLFTIAASPFTGAQPAAAGGLGAGAEGQPPSLPLGAAEDAAGSKRLRPDEGEQPAAARSLLPPRPPPLDVSHAIIVAGGHAKGVFRSPRGSSGSQPSPGGSVRRRQSTKMQGRVCIECGTTTTTQASRVRGGPVCSGVVREGQVNVLCAAHRWIWISRCPQICC